MKKVLAHDPVEILDSLPLDVMRDFADVYVEFIVYGLDKGYDSLEEYLDTLNGILKYFGSNITVKDAIRDEKGLNFIID